MEHNQIEYYENNSLRIQNEQYIRFFYSNFFAMSQIIDAYSYLSKVCVSFIVKA